MSNNKRGRPTISVKDYTVRVRLCQEELDMLDTLCLVEEKTRSQMIRQLIVEGIRANAFECQSNLTLDEHVKKLLSQKEIMEYLEDAYPLVDEIDIEDK